MQTKITVKDKREAALLKRGLADPPTRALVKIIGALLPLNDRARVRVLSYVDDVLQEREHEQSRR